MTDHDLVTAALLQLKPSIKPSADPAWGKVPALRVIDCVLSLNRDYDNFVVPRRDRFEAKHPHVRTVLDLHRVIASYASPHEFMLRTLHTNFEERAVALAQVARWLAQVSGNGSEADQSQNIESWAQRAQPDEYKALKIRGFALSGFQYLRMLFGANTCKPDLRIRQWVSKTIGREVSYTDARNLVSGVKALNLMEGAARDAGVSLCDADTTIWEMIARELKNPATFAGRNARDCGTGA